MYDADAAFLRQGNRQTALGHRIHGGRNQRHVERDVARQPGLQADIAGENGGMGGNEQNVVKSQCSLNYTHNL